MQPSHPCWLPNRSSSGQVGADLWWPVGGLQGPVPSVSPLLCNQWLFPLLAKGREGYMLLS